MMTLILVITQKTIYFWGHINDIVEECGTKSKKMGSHILWHA